MSIPEQHNEAELLYADSVSVVADSGGLRLIFTRTPASESLTPAPTQSDVIARLVLPPLAARRLLRLLPERLERQQALADDYARETEREAGADDDPGRGEARPADDPFLAALAAAEEDDEPYTAEERAAAKAGWEEYLRGETVPWEDVRRELLNEENAASASAP